MCEMSSQAEGNDAFLVPQSHVVKIVQLLGAIAGEDGDIYAKRRALMQGLAKIVAADAWVWTAPRVDMEEKRPIPVSVMYEGLSKEAYTALLDATLVSSERPPEDEPLSLLFAQGKHFTRTRQQLLADSVWYNDPTVQRTRLQHGIDHFLYSIYPIDEKCASAIGFYRRPGREPFADLERRLCHIVASNIAWLHRAVFPEHQGELCETQLTPKQRLVLLHLLDGQQRDEIADLLKVSPETVKTHVRMIYRHFDVTSQVELMHHFRAGNGGDVDTAMPPSVDL